MIILMISRNGKKVSRKNSPISTVGAFRELENLYIFENYKEIKNFLVTNDFLIEILFEAHKQIKRVFGEHIVEICLEHDRDPEEDFEGLSAIVKTNLSPELSLDLLDKFDEEWFLSIDDEIRIIFTVMVRPLGFEDFIWKYIRNPATRKIRGNPT